MIEVVYLMTSVVAIVAMAPQLRQIVVHKKADSFSLSSWIIWMVAQGVATIYGITIGAAPYVIISSIWFAYYTSVVTMIIYFRRRDALARSLTSAEEPVAIE